MRRIRAILRSQGGFTVIEMITVMAIIAVLSALVIANTGAGDARQRLRDAVSLYVTTARQAESDASSSQSVSGTARKAYGVCITTSSAPSGNACAAPVQPTQATTYKIFGRTAAQVAGGTLQAIGTAPVVSNSDILATHTLPSGFVFEPVPGFGYVWLDYVPPVPNLYANGQQSELTLKVRNSRKVGSCPNGTAPDCRSITIRPLAGAVYVQ